MDINKSSQGKINAKIVERYYPTSVEKKWQKVWEENKTFSVDIHNSKKPFYNLVMFPYPSAEGLHVGHIIPYSGADTFGRFMRMKGFDVFEPMGFDAFGIHSENFAIKKGIHPAKLTAQTTKYFRDEQMKKLGTLFDWERMVDTSSPNYYKWTQWLFTEMFKAGLAVRKKALVNWCPSCKTVLSDEQVVKQPNLTNLPNLPNLPNLTNTGIDVCERCKTEVERKEMEQWFFRITEYAERLLQGTYKINWSNKTLVAQRNWIGKSEGAVIKLRIKNQESGIKEIEVFTTRPDTLGGATFLVLAPEHPFVVSLRNPKSEIRNPKIRELIEQYVRIAKNKSEQERIAEGKEKTGVFTGYYVVNPLTNEEIPIWAADYVVMGYGSGAIMAVPAHDQRDFDFAKKYDLPIKTVINEVPKVPKVSKVSNVDIAYSGEGEIINSGEWNGWQYPEDLGKVIDWLVKHEFGEGKTTYRLRDWCISRQRYWGPPIPMIHCGVCAEKQITYFDYLNSKSETRNPKKIQNPNDQNPKQFRNSDFDIRISVKREAFAAMPGWFPVPEEDLPVLLPETNDYLPDGSGKSPLAKIPSFVKTKCPYCGGEAERETDVSDTFLDSAWYFLRYPSVEIRNPKSEIRNNIKTQNSNLKTRDDKLPFNQDITNKWLPVNMYIGGNEHAVLHLMYSRFVTMALHDMGYLDFEEPFTRFFAHGLMIKDGAKMSKSRGNVVNPNVYLEKFGADVLRMYVLFLGPYDGGGDFRDTGIEGMYRFLNRVYRWVMGEILNLKSQIPNKSQVQNSKLQTSQPSLRGATGGSDEVYPAPNGAGAIYSLKRAMHRLIKGVGEDLENLRFNTAIAKMMEYLNLVQSSKFNPSNSLGTFRVQSYSEKLKITLDYILLLSPLAPHLAEELFQEYRKAVGQTDFVSVHDQTWPEYDESLLQEEVVTIAVQVNGKLRATLEVPSDTTNNQEEVERLARLEENVKRYLDGHQEKRVVYVKAKLINFVI